MDSTIKGLSPPKSPLKGSNLSILIIHTRWNLPVVSELVYGAIQTLLEHGVLESNIKVHTVPGAYELPFATQTLIAKEKPDAVIPIGVLIKGSTMHFEYIADAVSHGLMRVGLDTKIPVIFGVLTCLTEEQAMVRAGKGPNSHNHGIDWGLAAIEMANMTESV